MVCNLRHDRFHRFAPPISGEGVRITCVHNHGACIPKPHLFAPELHLARAADVASEQARDMRTLYKLDQG